MTDQIQWNELMQVILWKVEDVGPSYLAYTKCSKCNTCSCSFLNQEFIECVGRVGRKGKIDESSCYHYCYICDGIK